MRTLRRSVVLLALAAAVTAPAVTGKKIVFETDMTFDVDDVGALAMLHALADRQAAEILAVVYNEMHPHAAAAISAINTWYGRPTLPIGLYRGPLDEPDASRYLEFLARFPHSLPAAPSASAPDVYRAVLRAQPDASVTIVSVGFLNNLDDLLRQEPDLVAAKVRELVVMGGRHDDAFNFARHGLAEATARVLQHWPTPVAITDFGFNVRTGLALASTSPENPVREAYYRWFGRSFQGRPSWDQIAVLYGVRGTGCYFALETSGTASLRNGFRLALAPGRRYYVVPRLPAADYARLIEELMALPPQPR